MARKITGGTYTTGEAARLCRLSQQTIIRCFDNGTISGWKVPGSKFRRIPRESLLKFMVENGIPTDLITAEAGATAEVQVAGPVRVDRGIGALVEEIEKAA